LPAPSVAVVIPFRDRGTDPLRQLNLDCVVKHWCDVVPHNWVVFANSDGREGDAQFNRSAAYNSAVRASKADVFVFTEADVIVPFHQVADAVMMAQERPGLVIPFDKYRYLGEEVSDRVRRGKLRPQDAEPQRVMWNGSSVGAVNVISRQAYDLVGGYDEQFEGSWYDDNAMAHAFAITCSPTRWIMGPVHHLYHLPGWRGDHLTEEDKAATIRNKFRLARYRKAGIPSEIRELTMEGRS
jgi:hypothetical protein